MPVNPSIRQYIETYLVAGAGEEEMVQQIEVVMLDLVALLSIVPDDAVHTCAYFNHTLSRELMRSTNADEQGRYAVRLGDLFQRLYNDATFIAAVSAGPRRARLRMVNAFYQLHFSLIFSGLRGTQGPLQLDAYAALRRLQYIVGAVEGPWHAHIRLNGRLHDYYHARLSEEGNNARIEIGRLPPISSSPALTLRVVTWNMQGASESSESKWRGHVVGLARSNDIVAIQEAGVRPFSSQLVAALSVQDQFGANYTVDHYRWQVGSSSRSEWYHIYFLDVKRARINLAIVVAERSAFDIRQPLIIADGLPDTQGIPFNRPALGLRLRRAGRASHGPTVSVYNFHAISGGGINAARVLREISWHAGTPFVLLGDFNRDPQAPDAAHPQRGNWISPPDIARLELAMHATHPATAPQNMLDYAVTNGTSEVAVPGQVDAPGPSDHRAVRYLFRFS